MPSAQEIIKEAASLIHRGELKELGFKKSAYTWTRGTDWPQIVNIQLMSSNSAERAKLTLNFGVYIEELHEALEACPIRSAIKEYDCDVRARIGQLLTDGDDLWWDVDVRSSPESLSDTLLSVLREYGLPWFERLQTFDSVAAELIRQHHYFSAAAASSLAGDANQATECMRLACEKAHRNALPKLRHIADKLNIPIPTQFSAQ